MAQKVNELEIVFVTMLIIRFIFLRVTNSVLYDVMLGV
jgi:hypothetical protein